MHNSSWYSLASVQEHKGYGSAFLWIGLVFILAGYGRAQNGAQVVAAAALKASPEQCEDVTNVAQCHRGYAAGCSNSAKPTYV
jgi:hypothetical protein